MTKYNYLSVSGYFTYRNIHSKLYIIFQYYLPTLYRYLWWRCSKGKGCFYWPDGELWIGRTPSILTLPTGLWCRYRTRIVIIMIIIIMILIIAIIMIIIIVVVITTMIIMIVLIVILVMIIIFNFQLSANCKISMVQCRTCAVQYKFTRYTPLPLPSLIFPTWIFSCISFCFTILLLLLFFFFLFCCLIAFAFALIFPFSFAFIPKGQECIATAGEVSLAETASMPQQMSMTICTNIPYVPY